MVNALEQEFKQIIQEVTKDVTDDVVKNSALKSVEKLNANIQQLSNSSDNLIHDIQLVQSMYNQVAQDSGRALNAFNKHTETWKKQQDQLLQKFQQIAETNKDILSQINIEMCAQLKHIDNDMTQLETKVKENDNQIVHQSNVQKSAWLASIAELDEKNTDLSKTVQKQQIVIQDMTKTVRNLVIFNIVILIGFIVKVIFF